MILFWFRRDLRIVDNAGFFHALSSEDSVLPAFVFDETILKKLPENDARVGFIHRELHTLNDTFKKYNSKLLVTPGNPADCIF